MLNTNTWRASGSEGKCWVKGPRAFALHRWANLPRAVRPLAASAPAVHIEASSGRSPSTAERFSTAQASESCSKQQQPIEPIGLHFHKPARLPSLTSSLLQSRCLSSALRSRARQFKAVRAATSFARSGCAVASASRATQRKMRAGIGVLRPRSNPSIERTSPGKPGADSHVKR
jgi:hypothetical protein